MSNIIKVQVKIDPHSIQRKLESLLDEKFMLMAHQELARRCDKYVPMGDTGNLSQTLEITHEYVRYTQPYAHYMYTGLVYGPNVPIIRNGMIVGWFSKAEKGGKYPTGESISYSKDRHPLATKEWDKAMMNTEGESFVEAIKQLLIRRAKELYG